MKKYIQPQTTAALLVEPIMNSAGTSVTKVNSEGPIQGLGDGYIDPQYAI